MMEWAIFIPIGIVICAFALAIVGECFAPQETGADQAMGYIAFSGDVDISPKRKAGALEFYKEDKNKLHSPRPK